MNKLKELAQNILFLTVYSIGFYIFYNSLMEAEIEKSFIVFFGLLTVSGFIFWEIKKSNQ
jgi:hypothetical protein